MKRTSLPIAAFVAAVLLIGLCLPVPAEDRVTIRFMHSLVNATTPALNKMLKDFEAENPGIHVVPEFVGDALKEKLMTTVAAGEPPDVAWVHADYISELAKNDVIYPLDTFIKGKDGLTDADLKDIPPGLIQMASDMDKKTKKYVLYSMPLETTTLCIIYNKDLFKAAGMNPEKPPIDTWDQFGKAAKKLTDPAKKQWGFFIPCWGSGSLSGWFDWQFRPFIWAAGGKLINDEGTKFLFNSPEGLKAFQFWYDLKYKYKGGTETPGDAGFNGGKVAMQIEGPWSIPVFQKLPFKWGAALLPKGPKYRRAPLGGEYLVIFKKSAHPEAAWKLIKFWTSTKRQAQWAIDSGYLPMRTSVMKDPAYVEYCKKVPGLLTFVEELKYAYPSEGIPVNWSKCVDEIAETMDRILKQKGVLKDLVDAAAAKCNQYLLEEEEEF
ncbi:MAG: ABC transporter substrate-binding protein [Patescibacteria group bacterium]